MIFLRNEMSLRRKIIKWLITLYIKRLNLVCGISLLIWKLPRELSKPAAPFKIPILTHFILFDYLKLDATNSLARCYVSLHGERTRNIWWIFFQSNLTFRRPCIVIYSYNKSQQDALFLNFILVKNSTCFGQIYCPSSGVLMLYTQQ